MTSKGLVSKSKIDAIKTAIRAKGAGAASMTLDEMATAIGTIGGGSSPTGTIQITENGTYDVAAYASAAVNVSSGGGGGGSDDLLLARIKNTLASYRSTETFTLVHSAFFKCTALKSLFLPNATANTDCIRESGVETLVIGSTGSVTGLERASSLIVADVINSGQIGSQTFALCSALNTIILRSSTLKALANVNVFNGTPFASGGTGGTIYVPSALIASYKAAANWSTVDGYGTITWTAIEGSAYENAYADGTPIS